MTKYHCSTCGSCSHNKRAHYGGAKKAADPLEEVVLPPANANTNKPKKAKKANASKANSRRKSASASRRKASSRRAPKGNKANQGNRPERPKLPEKDADGNHILYVAEPWFTLIQSGLKTIEARVYVGRFTEMKAGDKIKFITGREGETRKEMIKTIADLEKFPSFIEMFKKLKTFSIVPGVPDRICALRVFKRFYPIESEKKFGTVAIKLK